MGADESTRRMPCGHPKPQGRVPGWEGRLLQAIARQQAMPFAWGTADCATLAFAAIEAVTGRNLAADLPPWFSPFSALRAIRAAGCATAAEFFARRFREVPPSEAMRGDLVYPAGDPDPLSCPAVLTGSEAMSRNEVGWVVMPRHLAVAALRVE